MPFYDDVVPYMKKKTKDLADKLEEKRVNFNEYRAKSQVGTFAGLEDLIRKRKQEAQSNAKRDSY